MDQVPWSYEEIVCCPCTQVAVQAQGFRILPPGRAEAAGNPHHGPRQASGQDIPVEGDDESELEALRGLVRKYVEPLEPVGVEDWEASR